MKRILLVFGLLAAPAHAASFDCAKAASPDERAICADPRLSEMDSAISNAFDQARKTATGAESQKYITAMARTFLKDRRACVTDTSCILGASLAILTTYRNLGATVAVPDWANALTIAGNKTPSSAALPVRIGHCAATVVTEVTTRLDVGHPPKSEDFDSGTAINYRNKGHQVSYEREPALIDSKPGDKVVMCLISIPSGCPAGDARGRVYTATNTRTGASWTLPDSQHGCGGA